MNRKISREKCIGRAIQLEIQISDFQKSAIKKTKQVKEWKLRDWGFWGEEISLGNDLDSGFNQSLS